MNTPAFKRERQNAVPAQIRQAAVEMYRTNSARKVAEHFGISEPSVINFVRAAGEQIHAPFYRVPKP
jgi:transposase